MSYKTIIPFLSLILLSLFIFREWFNGGLITAGDFWPYFQSMYGLRSIIPYAWDPNGGGGMGSNSIPLLWIHLNLGIGVELFGKLFGFSWPTIERIYYLYPFLALAFLTPFLLFRKIFINANLAVLASGIYALNSYILMIVGGGQVHGVGMAYSLIPLVLLLTIASPTVKRACILGLLLSLLLLFDLRFFYISLFLLPVFVIFVLKEYTKKGIVFLVVLPIGLSILLHSFWILPLLLFPSNPFEELGTAYSSIEAVKFFSFAKLENSLSLLHPNWHENIFGRTSFLRPEFLLLPVLSFLALFFASIHGIKRRAVLFFSFVGLFGAFLAKGTNEPFGEIYINLFENMPGFQMYRDSTKFYVLIALSYSMLIPFSIDKIIEQLRKREAPKYVSIIILVSLVIYFLFLIHPALVGSLGGIFKSTTIPEEYAKLEKVLSEDEEFYRTLWIPTNQRFGYYSNLHPAISSDVYFKTSAVEMGNLLKDPKSLQKLQELSIKYVIIPFDSHGEIFLKDRKYSETLRQEVIDGLKDIQYLSEVPQFKSIKVYEILDPKKRFWSEVPNLVRSVITENPTKHTILIENASRGETVIFSESYDANWFAKPIDKKDSDSVIRSNPYNNNINSFVLREEGSYALEVFYLPQKYVQIGVVISLSCLILVLGYLAVVRIKKK